MNGSLSRSWSLSQWSNDPEGLRKSGVESFVRTPDSRTPHTCLPGGSIWARRRKWVWYDDEISDEPVRRRTMVWGSLAVNINHHSVFITLTVWPVTGCGVWCQHNQVITSSCSYTGNGRSRDTLSLVCGAVGSSEEQWGAGNTNNRKWLSSESQVLFSYRRAVTSSVAAVQHSAWLSISHDN